MSQGKWIYLMNLLKLCNCNVILIVVKKNSFSLVFQTCDMKIEKKLFKINDWSSIMKE